ncbi:mechanosensitive ion channel family protein, partial [bacterium]|nr:mechanosensitive ion channel family protein [bacterium]
IPIHQLLTLVSRPNSGREPWFPCKINDWVYLSDGTYGKVTGISLEFINIIIEGGSKQVLTLENFINASPINFSQHFVIKSVLGISYKHQSQCSEKILNLLRDYIEIKLTNSGYSTDVINLSTEVELLNESSIDLAIIVIFSGVAAPSYRKLCRSLQMWSMEACTKYDWEIPFPQLSVHH